MRAPRQKTCFAPGRPLDGPDWPSRRRRRRLDRGELFTFSPELVGPTVSRPSAWRACLHGGRASFSPLGRPACLAAAAAASRCAPSSGRVRRPVSHDWKISSKLSSPSDAAPGRPVGQVGPTRALVAPDSARLRAHQSARANLAGPKTNRPPRLHTGSRGLKIRRRQAARCKL